MTTLDRDALIATYRDGLLQDVLPFWLKHAPDDEHGGFLTAVDRDGTVLDTDKSIWHHGRFTWLLARLCVTLGEDPQWRSQALSGARFLEQHGFDARDGRMWFQVTRDGQPLRKRRYAFSEAFASLAFAGVYALTDEPRYREFAEQCLHAFLIHETSADPKFTDVRPTRGLGKPMIAIGLAQELRDLIQLPGADAVIDDAIGALATYHVHSGEQAVLETVGDEGEILDHFDGRLLNPGHALEASWFILREAEHREDQALTDLGTMMLDWTWSRGWDPSYGGILYFTDLRGLPPQEYWHDMKFWWPHNEGILATLYAFLLTGEAKYADWHQALHAWTYDHFPDPEHGEWFGYLHRDGRRSQDAKGNLWKGPFHIPRMQLIAWQLLERMSAG